MTETLFPYTALFRSELHAYSVAEDTPELRSQLDARLFELYPETAAAGVVHESTLCRSDCPRLGPGDFANRPTVATSLDGLVLAGDGIRIDLPVDRTSTRLNSSHYCASRMPSYS